MNCLQEKKRGGEKERGGRCIHNASKIAIGGGIAHLGNGVDVLIDGQTKARVLFLAVAGHFIEHVESISFGEFLEEPHSTVAVALLIQSRRPDANTQQVGDHSIDAPSHA